MAIRPIVRYPDRRLAMRELAADLLETMRTAPGIGITAQHIGVPLEWSSPEMIPQKEGSVLMPGVSDEVQRHARVPISYQDLDGNTQSEESDGCTPSDISTRSTSSTASSGSSGYRG